MDRAPIRARSGVYRPRSRWTSLGLSLVGDAIAFGLGMEPYPTPGQCRSPVRPFHTVEAEGVQAPRADAREVEGSNDVLKAASGGALLRTLPTKSGD